MNKLNKIIRKNGFVYEQIERTEDVALYCQMNGGLIIAHELFKIKKTDKPYVVFGKQYEAKEFFPCNSDFGTTAWSITKNADDAHKQYLNYIKYLD